jgi:hypothetical protein
VLVFVDAWLTQEEFLKQDPDQVVPRVLYMPDGRVVPTCVIFTEKQLITPPPLRDLSFPPDLVGGGYPVIADVQNQEHVGSLACLVTDGDSVYALTNRHVTGSRRIEELAGRELFTYMRGKRQRIGESDVKQIGKKFFSEVYPGWTGFRTYSTVDAGLIRLDDVNYWTAQVFGVGEMDDPVDLNVDTITVDLIGCPVKAFGGASGEMIGEIKALFYRYKSIGGFDYVSDLLIGTRSPKVSDGGNLNAGSQPQPQLKTRPGDSGTVWFFDPELTIEEARKVGKAGARARRLRPLALQWGGQELMDASGESTMHFALATCLSTICRELDVDIVRDWQIGHSEYWGKLGHYKIGAKACELVKSVKLRKLLLANLNLIAFTDKAIEEGELKKIDQEFVPLADVPDLVWRTSRKKDEANHFADMDEKGNGEFKNKTLLKLCEDPENVSIELWNRFYDSLGVGFKRGALPFRVWQIYLQMVKSVKAKNLDEFICAAGVLAHYVGDACQPLHVSFLHHGRPGHPEEEEVHSRYETNMLDRFASGIIAMVNETLKSKSGKADVNGGKAAAISVIDLMRSTIQKLPPMRIIDVHNSAAGVERTKVMFDNLGNKTAECIGDGCLRLASLWASAWKEGGGNSIATSKLVERVPGDVKKLYNTKTFLEAFRLQDPKFTEALA